MEYVTVVEIVDGTPSQVILFTGDRDYIARKAEERFLQMCSENIWNFDEYTQKDIDAILEDGHEGWGPDNSVSIVWPDVVK